MALKIPGLGSWEPRAEVMPWLDRMLATPWSAGICWGPGAGHSRFESEAAKGQGQGA